jgi:peptidyl-prolyl cis-trans isomerase C
VTLFTGALIACAPTGVQTPEPIAPDAIVAVVNGDPVKKVEYKAELDLTYNRLHESGQLIDGDMFMQLKADVVESFINLILLDQYSQKQGLQIDDAQVEQLYQKAMAKYPSKRQFKSSLKETGLTEADLRTRLKRTLSAQNVSQKLIVPTITVTDEEIKAYYDANAYEFEHDVQVHAAHILIKVFPFANAEDRQKAKQRILDIQKKVQEGEDFAVLAAKYSEGPSKIQGGDLGYLGSAQMAPAFETAAFSLQPGEVSDVVTTPFGFHLIKVYDRKPAGKVPFSEAGPQLKDRLYNERFNTRLRQLVEKLKAEANIERMPLD